ncbi:MAG: glycosyltransferase family 9 protein [Nitrospira sp.]|nr:glycosyltransferase family 9 protein [Nitrospira sp.]
MAHSILVIHPGALGDVLLAVPALRWLKKTFPDHHIQLISNEPVGRLLLECRLIDVWMSVHGALCADLCSGSIPDSIEIRRWLETCDFAVVWMKQEHPGLVAALKSCGVENIQIQSPFSPRLKSRHHSERFLETLGATMVGLSGDEPLQLSPSLLEKGGAALVNMGVARDRPLVLLHPGSGSRHKCTSVEVLAAVIVAMNQEGLCPLVLEGPADEAITAQLLHLLPMMPTVVREQDLSIVAGMMAHVQVYIGHDSGTTHLAALLGVPTIALFGPTDPEQWAPRGDHVVVLRGSPCVCPSWEAVRHCDDKPCLAISAGDIFSSVRRIIGHGLKSATPRNPSQYALSQQPPCAKVPS